MSKARQFPDRCCVVECLEGVNEVSVEQNPTRSFTYRQINDAASHLAHHLMKSGIEAGDVIVVYAHRCAELVVSIMGILRSGATFSVIGTAVDDP